MDSKNGTTANPKRLSAEIVEFQSRKRQKEAEQTAYSEHLAKLGRARQEIVAPAIQSLRRLGLGDKQIVAILEHAIKILREQNPNDAS
jgi:hypothetical protein